MSMVLFARQATFVCICVVVVVVVVVVVAVVYRSKVV